MWLLPSQNYLLLFEDIDVFKQAELAEQLRKVVRHLRGGASLAAGRCPPWWADTFKVAAAAWEAFGWESGDTGSMWSKGFYSHKKKKNAQTHPSRWNLQALSSLFLFTSAANAGKAALDGGEEGEEEVEEDEEEETGRDEDIEPRLSLQLSQSLPL